MSEVAPAKASKAGLPGWVMTFADLMTLLMCFFVLLLAFSEMDVVKFKQLSGSMKDAFGVQAEVEVRTIPKGTSVIAQEFSPGKPETTPINEVRQFTINSNLNTLDAMERVEREKDATEDHVSRIRLALREEIENGSVSVQVEGSKIIIQILEKASFESGFADVRPDFLPVLTKISHLIDKNVGMVTISGHTDDIPIANERFRSNWDLSTSRAVSVAHELLRNAELTPARFVVTGHADTRPRADNRTAENRAKNRRVEISIIRGLEPDEEREISVEQTPLPVAATEDTAS
ncbi:MAG: flagellar motor protein MotB [Gammaproteobacteria bacterium]|nr:flagellar motor protein MotB [Gammaproteobacteria bacterium]MDH4313279.1 flagellar motor protein MotB [Gammaproteobacteria bacterium]MDH5212920.1 flagellar motor protein MotB [Gammaproteobacteria bacterium]MDH5499473.1 flagellar motor protein MotB [Gammaproteobacteria bacterium]